ncbi:hypothetical protein QYM36_012158 [Artemia franciscana]|uniref:Dynein axonemal assembly factor 5 TPR repeats domain-containing protein n=2 Tax=Artemia franciscana TaxID=6661 RepID=A0AA88HPI4_ARTSF|nr:hypothetical protein QYM36_012158 [Artemia franciscana]
MKIMENVLSKEYTRIIWITCLSPSDFVVITENGKLYHLRCSIQSQDYTHSLVRSIENARSSVLVKGCLLVGCKRVLQCIQWSELPHCKKFQSINLDVKNSPRGFVSSLAVDEDGIVHAAIDNGEIQTIDLERGQIISKLSGHTQFIHALSVQPGTLASCSEDGSVRLWDLRTNTCRSTIEPYKDSKLARPKFGKWIGAVALEKDWLVCGGGPVLSMWHQRYNDVIQIFDCEESTTQAIKIAELDIFSGGNDGNVYRHRLSSEKVAKIPTSSSCIFALEYVEKQNKMEELSEVVAVLQDVKSTENKFQRRSKLLKAKETLTPLRKLGKECFLVLLEIATKDPSESCREIALEILLKSLDLITEDDIPTLMKLFTCIRHRIINEESETVVESLLETVNISLLRLKTIVYNKDYKKQLLPCMQDIIDVADWSIHTKSPDLKLMGCCVVDNAAEVFGTHLNLQKEKIVKSLVLQLDHHQGKVRKACCCTFGKLVTIDHNLPLDYEESLVKLVADQNFQVRLESTKLIRDWLISWEELGQYLCVFLPYLLISSLDEYEEIAEISSSTLKEVRVLFTSTDVRRQVLDKTEVFLNDWRGNIRTLGAKCVLGLLSIKCPLVEEEINRILDFATYLAGDPELIQFSKDVISSVVSSGYGRMALDYISDKEYSCSTLLILCTVIEGSASCNKLEELASKSLSLIENIRDRIYSDRKYHNQVSHSLDILTNQSLSKQSGFLLVFLIVELRYIFSNIENLTYRGCLRNTIMSWLDSSQSYYSEYLNYLALRGLSETAKVVHLREIAASVKDPQMIDLLLDLEDNLVKLISSKNIEEQQAGLTFLEAVLESCDSIKDENLLKLLSKLAYEKFLHILQWQQEVLSRHIRMLAARCLRQALRFVEKDYKQLSPALLDSIEDDSDLVRQEILLLTRDIGEGLNSSQRYSLISGVVSRLNDKSWEVRGLAAKVTAVLINQSEPVPEIEGKIKIMALFLKDEDVKTRTAVSESLESLRDKYKDVIDKLYPRTSLPGEVGKLAIS